MSINRFLLRISPALIAGACVGCALSQEQIDTIASAVQTGTQAVVTPIVSVAAPGIDAGAAAGIASAAGLGVAYLVRLILGWINSKKSS